MNAIFSRVPEGLRRKAETQLRESAENRSTRVKFVETQIWERYSHYEEIEHYLSQLHLKECCEAFSVEVSVWVPLFVAYAPEHLKQLLDTLVADAPSSPFSSPSELAELKRHREDLFRREVAKHRESSAVFPDTRGCAPPGRLPGDHD